MSSQSNGYLFQESDKQKTEKFNDFSNAVLEFEKFSDCEDNLQHSPYFPNVRPTSSVSVQ